MTTSSHPPTLLTLATRTLRDELHVPRGARLLVAVSGGPDSMALLHVLARLRAKLGFDVVAHGVDHGLRASAAAELDGAADFARALDVPFARTCLQVAPGSNLQARARKARYEALFAAAASAGASSVATAHHMEDRAETLLLRLLRGSGPAGLAVLPPRAPAPSSHVTSRRGSSRAVPSEEGAATAIDLVRPLLRAPRAAIDAHLARHAIPFAVDPSNRDPRFARTRVRHELLPLLRELSPGIVTHLCALADQLADSSPIPSADVVLSRGARELLKKALREGSTKSRVLLPGGLVATYVRTQASEGERFELAIEPDAK